MFSDKLVVRFVFVEGSNHVVAIAPSIGLGAIAFIAIRFGITNEIEPMSGPFFAVLGPVEKVIASQAASKRAQMVVMGTVGRRGVKARLVGNTAEKVLKHLNTDIIALKPEA